MATKNHFLNVEGNQIIPGASTGAPTRASSPAMARKDPADPTYNKTPAPVAYEFDRDASQNYGGNRYNGPSSLTPGQAEKARGIDAQNPDPVLDIVQQQSISREDKSENWQLRDIGDKNVGDAHGMESNRSRQASSHGESAAKVPEKSGSSEAPNPTINAYK